ncbi:MAG: hypothetical protein CVV41_00095 [Candidatus Riflebacteria bacterium HGW-Riflebacteria-1]|jgi:AcrR family transcriptional regulator|nr:MAG: hypothetical protein CVV41_00095 [Candidatus Riflebacteria bacterium HGW-Riflebacteria-1]
MINKKKSKKELLLEAGLDLFFEKGFERTTIDDIIGRADCGKGTFYRYFSNKETLMEELENVFAANLSREIENNCRNDMGVKEYLTTSLRTLLHVFKSHQRLGLIRFEREQRLNLEARKASSDKVLPTILTLRNYITAAIKKGAIRNLDPEQILGIVLGVAHFYLVRDFKLGQPCTKKEIEDSVDIILNGVI